MQDQEMQRCIEECTRCHQMCTSMVQDCLSKGAKHGEPGHIRVMLDCAQMCQTCADFMLRGSELYTETCRACAVVCERCAEECERMGDRECAEECRRCAESCHQMAGAHA